MNLLIREAVETDLPAIIRLLSSDVLGAQRENLDESSFVKYSSAFAEIHSDKNNHVIVVDKGTQVIGVCQLTIIPQLTYQGGRRAQIEGVHVLMKHIVAKVLARRCLDG